MSPPIEDGELYEIDIKTVIDETPTDQQMPPYAT